MEQPSQGSMDRAINFVIMARWQQKITIEVVQDAVRRLQGRHFAFEYGNQRNSKERSDRQSKLIPVMENDDCRDDSWRELAAQEMTMAFPADGPFVRINLLQNEIHTDILLTFDHQVCDGMSGVLLLRDLSYLLNHTDKTLPALPVQPAIWEIMPEKAVKDWFGKLRIAIFMKFLDLSARKDRNKTSAIFDPKYSINAFELDRQTGQALLDCCRRENTSVHAAISVAWMLALQSMLNESGQESRTLRSVSSPVSLRHLLPEDQKDCAGMYYSTVTASLDCNHAENFWESARNLKHQIKAETEKSSFYDMARFFKAMYARQSKLSEDETFKVPQLPVDYDFSISNLGKLDDYFEADQENAQYKIDAIYGPVVNAFPGEKTIGVCTLHGKIRFVFTSFVDDMEEGFIQSLVNEAQARLKIAVNTALQNTEL